MIIDSEQKNRTLGAHLAKMMVILIIYVSSRKDFCRSVESFLSHYLLVLPVLEVIF